MSVFSGKEWTAWHYGPLRLTLRVLYNLTPVRHDGIFIECQNRKHFWHDNPLYRFAARPDLCTDARIRANIARLADYGFSFDLQVFSGQMAGAAVLAESCPAVTFILQHAGMLEDLSPAGREAWRAGMRRLAACPNVVCKLSGLGTFIHRNDAAHIADIAREMVAVFGAQRCLFGSNFPIEKLWTSYRDLVGAYRTALGSLSDSDRDAILRSNAMRVYRLTQDAQAAAT